MKIVLSELVELVEEGERWAEEQARKRRSEMLQIKKVEEIREERKNVDRERLSPEVVVSNAYAQWTNSRPNEQVLKGSEAGNGKKNKDG